MLMQDVWNSDAFSVVEMTHALNQQPPVPGRIGQLKVFGPGRGITTATAVVEYQRNKLVLIDSKPRGTPAVQLETAPRKKVPILVPHFPKEATILADETTGVLAFGSTNQFVTVMDLVDQRLALLRAQFDATWEFLYARALHGIVIDPLGEVLLDCFQTFGFTEETVNFDLTNANSDVPGHCRAVKRLIEKNLQGDVSTGIRALCSPEWFDQFISHPKVVKAYETWVGLHPVRDDVRSGFTFQGITFEEYSAEVSNSKGVPQRYIDEETARFYPEGTRQTFDKVFAPAPWEGVTNTIGLPLYAALESLSDPKLGRRIDAQSNIIPMCLNPKVLVKGI